MGIGLDGSKSGDDVGRQQRQAMAAKTESVAGQQQSTKMWKPLVAASAALASVAVVAAAVVTAAVATAAVAAAAVVVATTTGADSSCSRHGCGARVGGAKTLKLLHF